MTRRSLLTLVCSVLMLSACGFQLRGQQDYAFKRLFISGGSAAAGARLTRIVQGGSDWFRSMGQSPYVEWYQNSLAIEGSPVERHHRELAGRKRKIPMRGQQRCNAHCVTALLMIYGNAFY